jgi:hypothetical protein
VFFLVKQCNLISIGRLYFLHLQGKSKSICRRTHIILFTKRTERTSYPESDGHYLEEHKMDIHRHRNFKPWITEKRSQIPGNMFHSELKNQTCCLNSTDRSDIWCNRTINYFQSQHIINIHNELLLSGFMKAYCILIASCR